MSLEVHRLSQLDRPRNGRATSLEDRLNLPCPLCGCNHYARAHRSGALVYEQCAACGLIAAKLVSASAPPNAQGHEASTGAAWDIDEATAAGALRAIDDAARTYGPGARVLLVGAPAVRLATPLERGGLGVHSTPAATEDLSPPDAWQGKRANVCVTLGALSQVPDPVAAARALHAALEPGGLVLAIEPSLADEIRRHAPNRHWQFLFDQETLRNLLFKSGFRKLGLVQLTSPAHGGRTGTPPGVEVVSVRGIAEEVQAGYRLSILMPVYNEHATFNTIVERVLAKDIAPLDKELIIVEQNSTDGTRSDVLRYKDDPRVKIILQDGPRGKGYAVRTALEAAGGDFILIQDADLEYDVDDYDALLEPLIRHERAFVLGSRHQRADWKIRKFVTAPGVSLTFNVAHVLFAKLINLLYGQSLRDPFTMFKVFRTDCVYDLHFECDRFDFDWELVFKLLRRGYVPREIPVNYVSRSYAEGKKVAPFRDPPTWLRALLRYRLLRDDQL